MSCAPAAEDYGLAILVERQTGEPADGTGELYTLVTADLHPPAYLTPEVFLAPRPHTACDRTCSCPHPRSRS